MENQKKIESILLKVEKPARYTGGEINSIIKKQGEYEAHFVFAFPDVYEIGMSHLGLQILYDVLNKHEKIYCERVFAPAADMEEKMRQENIPLFTLETKTEVKRADMVGFTLQYELSYSNILNMLDIAGIPMLSEDREESDPFIIAGGPCAYNPEPLADIIDFFIMGEGEEVNVEVMEAFIDWKKSKADKFEFLKKASQIKGVYVPSFYEPVYNEESLIQSIDKRYDFAPEKIEKRIVSDLDAAPYPDKVIVPFIDTVHNRTMVEIFRGCTRGCRFCQAGMIYRPVRERSSENIQSIADRLLKNTGFEEMSILSLSTSDYSNIGGLVSNLMKMCKNSDVSLSLPSLRLDSFSFKVMEEIQGYKKTGLTFAPEAGTQRLRDVINKSITDNDIYSAAEQAFELGWNSLKLYFMIGLPTETQEDLDGIVEIARNVAEIYYKVHGRKGGRLNVSVSVSNFVPKPHTPFQWFPQDNMETFREKHRYLKDRFFRMKNVSFRYHDNKTSYLEAVFARGDRRIGPVLIEAWKNGCKFDGWREYFDLDKWMAAFEKCGIDPDFYANRSRSYEEVLPWDLIDVGVSKSFFISENEKSLQEALSVDCRKHCINCGINQKFKCSIGGKNE